MKCIGKITSVPEYSTILIDAGLAVKVSIEGEKKVWTKTIIFINLYQAAVNSTPYMHRIIILIGSDS
jgi:hypothetical protein